MTDLQHRASSDTFRTEDYSYSGMYQAYETEMDWPGEAPASYNDLVRTLALADGTDLFPGAQEADIRCAHCNHRIKWVMVMWHKPTQTFVPVGFVCLENRFSRATAEFKHLMKARRLQKEQIKNRMKREQFLFNNPAIAAIYNDDATDYGDFISDVMRKLGEYGDLSEKQVAAVLTANERRIKRLEDRAAEKALAVPAPFGRTSFTGIILTTKIQSGDYGDSLKMLVKVHVLFGEPQHYMVWCSVPQILQDMLWKEQQTHEEATLKGAQISLTATLTPSAKDNTFAIGKRPTFHKLYTKLYKDTVE